MHKIAYYTTVAGAKASVEGIAAVKEGALEVAPLQSYFKTAFLARASARNASDFDPLRGAFGVDAVRLIKDDLAMERIPHDRRGLQRLEGELKTLKSVERPAIIKAIATAREHGDLSENAEYTSAREKQSFIEGRIAELEDIISRTEVIDFSKLTGKVHQVRRHRASGRRGYRREGEVSDRRSLRGGSAKGAFRSPRRSVVR